jgi:hypothetical protein
VRYLSPFPGARRTEILLQREEELRDAIKRGASAGKLAKAAERVRAAKLDIGKALDFALTQKQLKGDSVDAELKELKRDIARWENMFTDEIIEAYRT